MEEEIFYLFFVISKQLKCSYLHGYCSKKYDSGTVRFRILISLTLYIDYARISFLCKVKHSIFEITTYKQVPDYLIST
jgi:hypothetical protein